MRHQTNGRTKRPEGDEEMIETHEILLMLAPNGLLLAVGLFSKLLFERCDRAARREAR